MPETRVPTDMDTKHEPRKSNRRQAAIMLGIGATALAALWWNGNPNSNPDPPPTPQAEIAEQVFNETWEGMTLGDRNRMCAAYETLPAEHTIDSLMDKLDPAPEPDQYDDVRQVFITRFNEECGE